MALKRKKFVEQAADPGKRAAILDAAVALFAERGFFGTAVPLVAEKAGVGAGTMYRYFASKEALVNVLYRQWKGRLTGDILKEFPVDAPAREQFRFFWRKMVAFAVDHPDGFCFLELQHHQPYLDAESKALEESSLQMIRGFVERAQKLKQMKPGAPELLMGLVWGSIIGMLKAVHHGYLKLDDATIDRAEGLMWEAVRL